MNIPKLYKTRVKSILEDKMDDLDKKNWNISRKYKCKKWCKGTIRIQTKTNKREKWSKLFFISYVSGFPFLASDWNQIVLLSQRLLYFVYTSIRFVIYFACILLFLCHWYTDHLYLDSNSIVIYICIQIVLFSSVSTA